MGIRNMVILFLSALGLSLIILIVFFSLFFKNIDLSFDTKLPEAAPDLSDMVEDGDIPPGSNEPSKAEGVFHATINVPDEINHQSSAVAEDKPAEAAKDLAPIQGLPENPLATEETSKPADDRSSGQNVDKKSAKTVVKPVIQSKESSKPTPDLGSPPPAPTPGSPGEAKDVQTTQYNVILQGFSTKQDAELALPRVLDDAPGAFIRKNGSGYMIQLGSFGDKSNAESLAGQTGATVRPTH